MKQILILLLGALACVGSAKAGVNEYYALDSGKCWAAAKYKIEMQCYGSVDAEHIRDAQQTVVDLQAEAVATGARTPEEIDQYVNIAWHEMYLELKALTSVQGHKPT